MSSLRSSLLLAVILTAALVAARPLALATDPAPPVAAPVVSDDVGLEDVMGAMKGNLKALSQALSTPDGKDKALAAVREMQVLTIAGKGEVPFTIGELEQPEQGEQLSAYQAEMARLLSELALLEVDLLEGRSEAALARVTGALRKLRDDSHERWQ